MPRKIILKISLILITTNSLFSMPPEDLAQRNSRFNEAIRGTQYQHINQETSKISQLEQEINELKKTITTLTTNNGFSTRKITFNTTPFQEIDQEFDQFHRDQLLKNAPLKLQSKLSLLEEPEEFESDIFLLHGPPGSGKSSTAKLIAYITQSPFIFLKASGLGDSYRNSPQEYINALFQPLIEKKEKTVVILDELTGFTDKFEDKNSGESGAVQHLWTTFDECTQKSKVLIVATLNDIKRLPAPLRGRCREYYIDYPGYESRLNSLNHYFSSSASEQLILKLAKRSNALCLRKLQRTYKIATENLKNRRKAAKNPSLTMNDEDIEDAFQGVFAEQSQEKRDKLKKFLKEYGPILIIPLLRMGCDYALQYIYHNQQMAWNEHCFRENQRIQNEHHTDNLNQQRDLANKHHRENVKINEEHHTANLSVQEKHNQASLYQQTWSGLSYITGPAVYALIAATGYGTIAIIAGAATSCATSTVPKWFPKVYDASQGCSSNVNKIVPPAEVREQLNIQMQIAHSLLKK